MDKFTARLELLDGLYYWYNNDPVFCKDGLRKIFGRTFTKPCIEVTISRRKIAGSKRVFIEFEESGTYWSTIIDDQGATLINSGVVLDVASEILKKEFDLDYDIYTFWIKAKPV